MIDLIWIAAGSVLIGTAIYVVMKLKSICFAKSKTVAESSSGNEFTAKVFCGGTNDHADKKFIYKGVFDCNAAKLLNGGDKVCSAGCIGLGSCVRLCPQKAIILINGIAAVDSKKCNGCGECIEGCPNNVIKLIPAKSTNWVGCNLSAYDVAYACDTGCNGCGKCIDVCESGAVTFQSNHAVIDAYKCICCGKCTDICETKAVWTANISEKSEA